MLAEIAGIGMSELVFVLAGFAAIVAAFSVVTSPSPVQSALGLVATLFSVAVLFVSEDAHFLAAVQIIVYAGAIVVLFLFVIMLLGVDRLDDLETEPLVAQRPLALIASAALLVAAIATYLLTTRDYDSVVTGAGKAAGDSGSMFGSGYDNLTGLARLVFTDYLYAFEITSVLLVIAVVGAVVLARRTPKADEVSR